MATLVMAAVLPACGGGGGGNNNPTPVTQPPAPVRTQIGSGNFSLQSIATANTVGLPLDVLAVPLSVTGSGTGTVEIVADWTFASSDIDIWFINGSCTSTQAARSQCPIAAGTTSVTAKPERLTVTGVSAGSYTIAFANFSNRAESGNFQVFLTR